MPHPFKIWYEHDGEGDSIVLEAYDFDGAVKEACGQYMSENDGHEWLDGATLFCKEENGETKKFKIEVEYEPVFGIYEQEEKA